MKKTICFTIDIEPDFAGLIQEHFYFGKKDLRKLVDIVEQRSLKITAFVTGKALEQNPDILDVLKAMRAEIEQHSYSHQIGHNNKVKDIKKGIEIHEQIVGQRPQGYRAPQGIISREEARVLHDLGIKFDSSIFPTFFPGRFNRLGFPLCPFVIKDSNLIEIPFAVIPKIRLPIGLSYMQIIGINTFKFLSKIFGLPDLIVYDFHSYELGKLSSYQKLSLSGRMGYYRAQRTYKDPFSVFGKFVEYILSKGYESKYMIDVYNQVKDRAPEWGWDAH
jgi:peptidoglycan/xylan/chitin deacetylase (PgdA/CDA1 family)